ncbi:hypothetical protein BofuT4_P114210.1 [Botrytis cinerea T4]|uniref:Uncharacterized protein n=1 Tax=Botryotinia fuckeliana (strain T4) TaxID=999810 RepID=G2Y5H7_BOTF4|nr:hypothetical protein BofuT4_P114210.1 [Botrytis cinerea T4]
MNGGLITLVRVYGDTSMHNTPPTSTHMYHIMPAIIRFLDHSTLPNASHP